METYVCVLACGVSFFAGALAYHALVSGDPISSQPVYISPEVWLRDDLEKSLVRERASRMILEIENDQLRRGVFAFVPQKEDLL